MNLQKLQRRPRVRILRNPRIPVRIQQLPVLRLQAVGNHEAKIVLQRYQMFIERPMHGSPEQDGIPDRIRTTRMHRPYVATLRLRFPASVFLPAAREATTTTIFQSCLLPQLQPPLCSADDIEPARFVLVTRGILCQAVMSSGRTGHIHVFENGKRLGIRDRTHCS